MEKKKRLIMLLCVGCLVLAVCIRTGDRFGGQQTAGWGSVALDESTANLQTAANKTGATQITLTQDGSMVLGTGASVLGNQITIDRGGSYFLTGTLYEGRIYVDAGNDDSIELHLSGADIRNSSDAAIYVENAGHTAVFLEEGTDNLLLSGILTDRMDVTKERAGADAKGAALYARDDLSVSGTGSLTVLGYINNGIHTTDHLVIDGGDIHMQALNHGVKGKDSVTIMGGSLDIHAGGDGVQTDDLFMLYGGALTIAAGDEGIHADSAIMIEDGAVLITESREGLEANRISIRGGTIGITSSDDGINACAWKENKKDSPKDGDRFPEIRFTGGTTYVCAEGDGLDSNGNILFEGGVVVVERPPDDDDAALDAGVENGGICVVSGGTVLTVGGMEMETAFDESSTQHSFWHNFDMPFQAGDEIIITDGQDKVLYKHTASETGAFVAFSSPKLVGGETYTLQAGAQRAQMTLDQ